VDTANQVMEDYSQDQFWENRWKPTRLIFLILNHCLTLKNPAFCNSGRWSIFPNEIFALTLPRSFSPERWEQANL